MINENEMLEIERVRAYWDRQPCNIRYSKNKPGTQAWSDEVTARKYFVGSHIPAFAQFDRWQDARVLEIGCGIGSDTLRFLKAGAHVSVCDLSPRSIDLVTERCQSGDDLYAYCCNAEEWLPDGPFDLVYSFGVLHHTPHPERVLKLVYDRLKVGGELRIMLYAKWSIKNLTRQQPEAQAGCPIVRTYTDRSVRRLLKDFHVVSIEKTHIFPWRVSDYVQHRYVMNPPYRWMPETWFRTLERLAGWHLLVTAVKTSIPCHGESQ